MVSPLELPTQRTEPPSAEGLRQLGAIYVEMLAPLGSLISTAPSSSENLRLVIDWAGNRLLNESAVQNVSVRSFPRFQKFRNTMGAESWSALEDDMRQVAGSQGLDFDALVNAASVFAGGAPIPAAGLSELDAQRLAADDDPTTF